MLETTPSDLPAAVRGALLEALALFPYIDMAVLFGSVAVGCARADSDLDLAVSAQRALTVSEKMALTQTLAEKTGRPVDLIDLATVEEPLLGQVVKHGKLVLGTRAQFAQLMVRHLIEQADFVPYRNRVLAERRMQWIGK